MNYYHYYHPGYRSSYSYPYSQRYYSRETQQNGAVAYAEIKGGPLAPEIRGTVILFETPHGTEVFAEVTGLPEYRPRNESKAPVGPHGYHIHENGSCDIGEQNNPFQDAGGHWNPRNQPHGNHAGDFPVLFSNNGYSRMSFFTNKFSVRESIGKAIIIHENPDDFESQPSGDAGKRLACGVITQLR